MRERSASILMELTPPRLAAAAVLGGALALAAVVLLAMQAPAAEQGESLTRYTVRLSLAWYAVSLCLLMNLAPADRLARSLLGRAARWCWTWALAVFLVHLAMAFHYYHHWSHAHAFARTREISGLGEGIYVSYFFTLLWIGDVAWWWLAADRYAARSVWIDRALHGFMLAIVFNGMVVFEAGLIRWAGVAMFLGLAIAWMIASRARQTAQVALALVVAALGAAGSRAASPSFEEQIGPLVAARCVRCHGGEKLESGLDLGSLSAILRGGESGPAVVPGAADESLLWQRIAAGEMPPEGQPPLNADELALVRDWIARGDFSAAAADDAWQQRLREGEAFWSFARPRRPAVPSPAARHGQRAAHPIDAFLLTALDQAGLDPAPLADRATLVRRLYVDLWGLPPAPEEVEAFLADASPDAWERLVQRLLDSKHYAQRWARHWLDVARYADTGGYETDIYFKNAWRYRDYVVEAFHQDKPYDRFVQEQVAGDELWPDNLELEGSYQFAPEKLEHLEAHVATGFYALGTQVHESNMDARKRRYEELTDWVDATGSAFLGLTVGCARCHDHKFDPISQRDYFSLQAVFAGTKIIEIPIVNGMEIADHKQYYPKLLAVVEARTRYRLFEARTAGRALSDDEVHERDALKLAIAEAVLALPERAGSTPNTPWDGLLDVPTASVLGHERPELVKAVNRLSRGDLDRPRESMDPALPELLARQTESSPWLPGPIGSRQELARWLTRPDHPLTARVLVNRVWGWHFGEGLVRTPNDFGQMGQRPTHSELLDWLAVEFVERGWSLKALHRLIVTSSAYRQASDFYSPLHARLDPDNKLLWRMNRRRLEGEAVWDAIHAVAGTLNLKAGGPAVMPPLVADEMTDKAQWVVNADPAEHRRRGMYIVVRRSFQFPLFEVFDAPVNSVSCAARNVSTVAPQALWLLNNQTAFGQSRAFAERVVREAGTDAAAQVDRAFFLALARPPRDDERADSLALLDALAAAPDATGPDATGPGAVVPGAISAGGDALSALEPRRARALALFCLTLLNLNEFLYID